MQSEAQILNNCVALLKQAADLMQQISDEEYAATSVISPRASIGGHLRHLADFYQAFLAGVRSARVNYNQRERNEAIERDRVSAQLRLAELTAELRVLALTAPCGDLLVATEDAGAPEVSWAQSSVLRELDFLQSHTIHHYSLIAMLLRSQAIEPDPAFGVAPSTLEHWKRAATCAR